MKNIKYTKNKRHNGVQISFNYETTDGRIMQVEMSV